MAQDQQITAYDLARDIAKELADITYDVPVEWIDGEPYASLDQGDVVPVVERMLAAALRNGGIRS